MLHMLCSTQALATQQCSCADASMRCSTEHEISLDTSYVLRVPTMTSILCKDTADMWRRVPWSLHCVRQSDCSSLAHVCHCMRATLLSHAHQKLTEQQVLSTSTMCHRWVRRPAHSRKEVHQISNETYSNPIGQLVMLCACVCRSMEGKLGCLMFQSATAASSCPPEADREAGAERLDKVPPAGWDVQRLPRLQHHILVRRTAKLRELGCIGRFQVDLAGVGVHAFWVGV